MKDNIAFTVGRTQPPHKAHYNMLADALLNLCDEGKLIHFIGSSNMPLSCAEGSKNILSFEQRREMLTRGLTDELMRRYQRDPDKIPLKFAMRMKRAGTLLTTDDFECIAVPDFSDPKAVFSTSLEQIRNLAVAQVESMGIGTHEQGHVVLSDTFQQTLDTMVMSLQEDHALNTDASPAVIRDITRYGSYYMAWAVNVVNLLDAQVTAYRERTGHVRPTVAFPCCDKDKGTLQYILLIAAVIACPGHPHAYAFSLRLSPIEMQSADDPISATAIRQAFITIVSSEEKIKKLKERSEDLIQAFPVLTQMSDADQQCLLEAMQKLQAKPSP